MLLVIFVSTVASPGEHLFLCGSYSKSSETWRSQICEESSKSKNCSLGCYVYATPCGHSRAEMIDMSLCRVRSCSWRLQGDAALPGPAVQSSVPVPTERGAGARGPHGPTDPEQGRTPEEQYGLETENIIISITAQCNTHSQTDKQVQTVFNSL